MLEAKPFPTPMVARYFKLSKEGSESMTGATLLRSVVGALQYATTARHDICFAVNKVCQFMAKPLEAHWLAVKNDALKIPQRYSFMGSAPGSYIYFSSFLLKHSVMQIGGLTQMIEGQPLVLVFLEPNLSTGWAKKQLVISRPSTEAEYRSLALATSEILWIQSLHTELGISYSSPTIHFDNMSTISLAHNPILHARTKHMELDHFFVREKVLQKLLRVVLIPGHLQCADVLTKALPPIKFEEFRSKL
jgi:histone deacetylase 1/2